MDLRSWLEFLPIVLVLGVVCQMIGAETDLRVVVQNDRIVFECECNATSGSDWHFINAANETRTAFAEGYIPPQIKDHYLITTINDSVRPKTILTIKNITSSQAGTYECRDVVQQSSSSTYLGVITHVTCHINRSNSADEPIEGHCSFSITGRNISVNQDWEWCSNESQWNCDVSNGAAPCEVKMNLISNITHKNYIKFPDPPKDLGSCRISCITKENEAESDIWVYVSKTLWFKVNLNCPHRPMNKAPTSSTSKSDVNVIYIYAGPAAGLLVGLLVVIAAVLVCRLKKKDNDITDEIAGSEFGTLKMVNNDASNGVYQEISDLDIAHDYYNLPPEIKDNPVVFMTNSLYNSSSAAQNLGGEDADGYLTNTEITREMN